MCCARLGGLIPSRSDALYVHKRIVLSLTPREENQWKEKCDGVTQQSGGERERTKKTLLNLATGDL